jgi:hypothetical protein
MLLYCSSTILDEVIVLDQTLVYILTLSLCHESVHLHRCPKYG